MPAIRPFAYMLAGAVGAIAGQRLTQAGLVRLARMSGSSIASPRAVGWVTDFLNAAYYRRPPDARSVDDLRLAFCILTTRWHHLGGRKLDVHDVAPFHGAFGAARFLDRSRSSRGLLDRRQLLAGATRLLGDWFPEAYGDPKRRGWGIAFRSAHEKAGYEPGLRLRNAPVGALTPPAAPGWEQTWHTYPPITVPSADDALQALLAPETWPDYGSELGRFTALRSRGLDGQTFEIEVVGFPTSRTPVWLRAYVTVTTLVSRANPAALERYVHEVTNGFRRFGHDEPDPIPERAEPIAALDLTCHEGHFMGRAKNRLFLYTQDGQAYLRAAGTWDPMDWHLDQVYLRAGRYAQHAFWGMGSPEESMLRQVAQALESGRVAA